MIGRAITGLLFAFLLTALPAQSNAMDGIASVYGFKGDKHGGSKTANSSNGVSARPKTRKSSI